MALTIERIDSGCASNPMLVLIRLTAPCGLRLTGLELLWEKKRKLVKLNKGGGGGKNLEL